MRHRNRGVVLIFVGVALAGCAAVQAAPGAPSGPGISAVERIEGSDVSRVRLSADAAHRLGIQTDVVRETVVAGQLRKVVPYAAVLYDATGRTYAYGNPTPLVFVRVPLVVDVVTGELAVLVDGPPLGTAVVTVGASELFGTEFEVGGE